ncbi:methyltransferase-domain-containing protein [Gorgonomyces haynaldii]|nr:methyltransferase-domain-containing protein [Gorgonomyces haynaldii]
MSDLQTKMQQKLDGSKFRWLNETLYTSDSQNAITLFQADPELFDIYHKGFASQVKQWPVNPVDVFIKQLSSEPKLTVCDMGCGEAKLAQTLSKKHKIHSFDLVSVNEYITACDIAHVPLKDNQVDVCIFSLSLMGTNFVDFLLEARRILKMGARLKIAEVISRIDNLPEWINGVEQLGFKKTKQETLSKMFIMLEFKKTSNSGEAQLLLKPCLYKKR